MASDTITNNLNEIISTKNEFKNIIRENGGEPGTVFSEYPSQIRSIISGGSMSSDTINTYISSYLDTYNFIDADEISQMGYVTAADIPEVDLSSYVTYDYLSAQGYVTSVPVIDENIIPKETSTYTLGDVDHFYARTYTGTIQSGSGGLIFRVGNSNTVTIGGGDMRPSTDGAQSLGRSSNHWNNGYINNIYTNTAYLQDTSYTKSIVPTENNSYTLGDASHLYAASYVSDMWLASDTRFSYRSVNQVNLYMNGNWRYIFHSNNFSPGMNNNSINLGSQNYKWGSTYTQNLYADTIHNFIWTGTSAEYAALDNYTSYQIYMIEKDAN